MFSPILTEIMSPWMSHSLRIVLQEESVSEESNYPTMATLPYPNSHTIVKFLGKPTIKRIS